APSGRGGSDRSAARPVRSVRSPRGDGCRSEVQSDPAPPRRDRVGAGPDHRPEPRRTVRKYLPVASPESPTAPPRRPRRKMAYRHDIHGLRGLAIALVVAFHLWMGRVSGGVDVFLTLSGFFFLGSLMRGAADDRTSLNPLPHLKRLARRLYPALVVTVTATVAGTLLIKPPTQWSAILDQTAATLLYYQNWELAFTSQDYAAADATISPMQHLWSMSVQGQFYVLALVVVLGLTALW